MLEDLEVVWVIWVYFDGFLVGWVEVFVVVWEYLEISELNVQVVQKYVDVVDECWRGGVG